MSANARKQVLLVSEVFPPRVGGSGRWFWELYRRLPADQVILAADECPGHEASDAQLAATVCRLPLAFTDRGLRRDLFTYLRAARRLQAVVAAHGIRCIHAGRCLPEGLLAFMLGWWNRLPYVCYVHGEDLSMMGSSRELSLLARRVLARADTIIANSRHSRDMVVREWPVPASKVRILHPGVDTQHFQPAPREPQTRARLGWGDRPVVLTVGRLQKRKGQDRLIQAVSSLRGEFPELLCAIVGAGHELPALQALTKELQLDGHVQFLTAADDVTLCQCYQQSDVFVLANRTIGGDFEGFGMVLLEAQACGKPVIAGASGGTAETMQVPETGLVIPCEEPQPLAATLAELLRDPARRARMGAAGRQWVVEHFDWEALARQAEQLFFQDR